MQISIEAKKTYLKYVLNEANLQAPLIQYLVTYILRNETILNNLSFVKNVEFTPRGLLIKQTHKQTEAYLYIDGQRITHPATIYQQLNLGMKLPLYIDFELIKKTKLDGQVYVNNPYLDESEQFSQEVRDYVDSFISRQAINYEQEQILKQLDEALITHDEEEFLALSAAYNDLEKMRKYHLES